MPIALAAPRIALVIGNGNYADKPLSHPKRDAADVAALLRGLGFEVTEVTDLNLEQIEQRVRDFIDAGRTSSVRLFYYSGHGANHQNDSYLLPVGHGIQRAYEIKRRAYPVETLLEGLRAEASDGVNVILLDACRDAPFGESKSIGAEHKGLGRVVASAGTLVAYAAAPGQTAEGRHADRNSLFTKHLLKNLPARAEINEVLTRVRSAVVAENPQQLPETRSLLTQPLFLAGAEVLAPPTPPSADNADLVAWQSAERCGTAVCYREYLADHPQGKFANLARARLTSEPAPAPAPQTPTITILKGKFLSEATWSGGGDVQIKGDIDADGVDEEIILGRDHPNGIKFAVIDDNLSIPLGLHGELVDRLFDEYGDPKEDEKYLMHLAIKDVTNDGIPDIIVALGNVLEDIVFPSQFQIFQFDGKKQDHRGRMIPEFNEIVYRDAQTEIRFKEGNYIEIPIGSFGLLDELKWDGEKFVEWDGDKWKKLEK